MGGSVVSVKGYKVEKLMSKRLKQMTGIERKATVDQGAKISTLNPLLLNRSKSASLVTQVQPCSMATAAC